MHDQRAGCALQRVPYRSIEAHRVLERAGLIRRQIAGCAHICRLDLALLAASDWLRFYEQL
jgi:hypothetical protein